MNRKNTKRRLFLCLLAFALLLTACGGSGDTASETESEKESETDTEISRLPSTDKKPSKRIAFTFDDGPHPVYTQKIADKAKELGGAVTFFVVGERVYAEREVFAYIANTESEIGIHGFSHTVYYDECDDDTYRFELTRTLELARQYVPDFSTMLMRPIGGRISAERAEESPYAVIKWNIDTLDWQHKTNATEEEKAENVSFIVEHILKNAHDGAIVLMHDLYENSYLAFCEAAEQLVADGYALVTVSELLGGTVQAGHIYSHGFPASEVGAK